MPDGFCYEVQDAITVNTNDVVATYANCSTCETANPTPTPTATPTPTPTPTPICNAVSLEFVATVEDIQCANYATFYINSSDFCTATRLDRTSVCDRLALPGIYNDGSNHRYWNGTAFTGSCVTTTCP